MLSSPLLPLLLLASLLAFSSSPTTCAPLWGMEGHSTVANVAEYLLNPQASSEISALLVNSSGGLGAISSWADSILRYQEYSWSAPLHYADAPDWACKYTDDDCPEQGCVVTAVLNYTEQLASRDLYERERALRFAVHFYGDIHQPLHTGFLSDKGGNEIKGKYNGKSYNLHQVWDTQLVRTRVSEFPSEADYIQFILAQIKTTWSSKRYIWTKCISGEFPCPEEWANESARLACKNAYVDTDGEPLKSGFVLGDEYYQQNKDVIDLRIAQAAIRLAKALNNAFSRETDREEKKR
eukprot:TRINITY_DN8028_c0_g1_i1.p1 TRINITY_DN8028_c0_g1~~TRINITY_DN8028_c0_g1_i1.p1  ORF type:complete len:295 (-),score=44.13 TRINITY_DN8028_c0_g1_i1:94-978(-)